MSNVTRALSLVLLLVAACGAGQERLPSTTATSSAEACCPGMHGMHGAGTHGGAAQASRGHGGAGMMGGGGMGAQAEGAHPVRSTSAAPLSETTKAALLEAIAEEERAEALYARAAVKLGSRPPITPVARSERRHAWVLRTLAVAHGLAVPAASTAATPGPEPATLAEACAAGVESERKTIALYDDLLKRDLAPDVRMAFEHLREASVAHHLPAFLACAR